MKIYFCLYDCDSLEDQVVQAELGAVMELAEAKEKVKERLGLSDEELKDMKWEKFIAFVRQVFEN